MTKAERIVAGAIGFNLVAVSINATLVATTGPSPLKFGCLLVNFVALSISARTFHRLQ